MGARPSRYMNTIEVGSEHKEILTGKGGSNEWRRAAASGWVTAWIFWCELLPFIAPPTGNCKQLIIIKM
jgi:hypothetical protein